MNLSERIKAARAALGLKQEEVVSKSGIPIGSLRKYEGGHSAPGADAIAGLVRLGINSNWLLTGEGQMLLSVSAAPPALSKSEPPATMVINEEILAIIMLAGEHARPGTSRAELAVEAMRMYADFVAEGLVTPDGVLMIKKVA
jgi:transcriptional regulator with XRE-family HTH domain